MEATSFTCLEELLCDKNCQNHFTLLPQHVNSISLPMNYDQKGRGERD